MTVYVEYAFAENFLLDGLLLYLSFRAAKTPFRWRNLLLSAFFGATFALLFPLLVLPAFLANILKFAVGFLLCLTAFGRVKTKKEWGRYAFTCFLFFCFSFAFAGALFGAWGNFSQSPAPLFVLIGFAFLTVFFTEIIKKAWEKRAVQKFTYDCAILYKQRRAAISGFLDSGNFAQKNGKPVCFVSPDVVYDLWEAEMEEERGQVRDEICISTLGGEKTLPLYKGSLEICTNEGVFQIKEVYFCPSVNILSREYKMLLNSRIFEEKQVKNEEKQVK